MHLKLDMNAPLLLLTGEPMIAPDTGKPATLRTAIQGACLAPLPGDQHSGWDEKARIFALAADANNAAVDWPIEDIALVKARIGEAMSIAVIGAVAAVFDGAANAPAA